MIANGIRRRLVVSSLVSSSSSIHRHTRARARSSTRSLAPTSRTQLCARPRLARATIERYARPRSRRMRRQLIFFFSNHARARTRPASRVTH